MEKDIKQHTVSVLVENKFGALARIAGLFSGRGYNIESLTVNHTHDPNLSRMTIVTRGDDDVLEQIEKQLNKLVDVVSVTDLDSEDYLELAKGYSSNKNGVEYAYLKYSCTAGGIDVVSDGCFFDSQRGVVSLCMGVSNTVKEDYSDISAEIIHSVDKASGFI